MREGNTHLSRQVTGLESAVTAISGYRPNQTLSPEVSICPQAVPTLVRLKYVYPYAELSMSSQFVLVIALEVLT